MAIFSHENKLRNVKFSNLNKPSCANLDFFYPEPIDKSLYSNLFDKFILSYCFFNGSFEFVLQDEISKSIFTEKFLYYIEKFFKKKSFDPLDHPGKNLIDDKNWRNIGDNKSLKEINLMSERQLNLFDYFLPQLRKEQIPKHIFMKVSNYFNQIENKNILDCFVFFKGDLLFYQKSKLVCFFMSEYLFSKFYNDDKHRDIKQLQKNIMISDDQSGHNKHFLNFQNYFEPNCDSFYGNFFQKRNNLIFMKNENEALEFYIPITEYQNNFEESYTK